MTDFRPNRPKSIRSGRTALGAMFAAMTFAFGTSAMADSAAASEDSPDFSRHIAPILQRHCQECHRPGEIAPMSLLTYEDARPWARSIRKAVQERTMPPWHAEPGVQRYANDRSLSEAEIASVTAWVDSGAREGSPADLPPPLEFAEGEWELGEPDTILTFNEPYQIPAEGDDDYHCFVLDPQLEEDRWVTAVEILAGNRQVDHHIVLYVDKQGISVQNDAAEEGEGYTCFGGPGGFMAHMLGGWGPGGVPKIHPEGTGHLIPAGSKIVMQMHYHPSGKPETDKTRVGLHYADKPVPKMLRDGLILNFDIRIPPGEASYTERQEKRIMRDITVHSVTPHMHLLGKSAQMWATLPDGTRLDLVRVPRYDFHWQTEYEFVEPIKIPRGSTMHVECTFDNSAESPFQPSDPPRLVTFGEQTTDEMLVGVYFYTKDDEDLSGEWIP